MRKIANRLRARYNEAGKRKEKAVATKEDLKHLKRDLNQRLPKQQPTTVQTMGRAVRMAGRGLGNIGRSLNSPYDTRRPKIAQLPMRRKDMGIVGHVNLDNMKYPSMRGRDLRGKKMR